MTLFKERRNLDVPSLWGVTPCRLQKSQRRCGWAWYLHLQGIRSI